MSCESLQSEHPFTHVVLLDGEPIKKFRSLREAKWFTTNKEDATIEKLAVPERKSVFDIYEEAPF
jgi:hypothetical protein